MISAYDFADIPTASYMLRSALPLIEPSPYLMPKPHHYPNKSEISLPLWPLVLVPVNFL